MRFQRLRILIEDEPGRLGEVAAALGRLGVNIVDLDVHSINGTSRIDEVVAGFTVPVDIPAIEHLVRGAGGVLLDVRPADAHELRDRATTALELATTLLRTMDADSQPVRDAARQLVGAELAWEASGSAPGAAPPIVRQVLETRSPAQVDGPVKRLPAGARSTWQLGLPFESTEGDAVLVLVRRGARFTFTETARVQALLRLHGAVHSASRGDGEQLADGGVVDIRDLRLTDFDAVLRLHRRCGAVSLYRRYFSPLPSSPERMLRQLVDVDGTSRLGYVATLGTEIVGVAHAFRTRAGDVEVAFLVEDGHQRRGIGSLLFERLSRRLVDLGVHEAYALTLADNEGMRRLMSRAEQRSTAWEDGVLRTTARLIDAPKSRTEAPAATETL